MRANSITVDCPICNGPHTYGPADLEPWPPRRGETRTVKCQYMNHINKLATNGNIAAMRELAWGNPMQHINITF